jgi:hypothetical protein
VEIQLGILKLLPGAPVSRDNESGLRCNPLPPYEVQETSAMSAGELARIRNFARFWEIVINRGLIDIYTSGLAGKPVFYKFLCLSDTLFAHFGKNWGIDKIDLYRAVTDNLIES